MRRPVRLLQPLRERDPVVILEVFAKTSQATPKPTIELCKQRLHRYDEATKGRSRGRSERFVVCLRRFGAKEPVG
jgi:hypothetical protein